MERKRYPLVQAQEIERLLKKFRKLGSENSHLITKIENEDLVYFADIDYPNFYFRIYKPTFSQGRPYFHCDFFPLSPEKYEKITHLGELNKIQELFIYWKGMIESYNEINFNEDELLTKQYEEEFYSEFQIIDDDADIAAFDDNQQKFLYYLFETINRELRKIESNNIVDEIIAETESVKNNIQNFTKKALIKKLANVSGRIKKYSVKLFWEIFDVAKKEMIKKVLYGGFDEVQHLISSLH